MPTITRLQIQQRRPNRVSVFLDGEFSFGCNKRVAERFGLKVGMDVAQAEVDAILQGQVRQECFDKAMDYISRRMHAREELKRKLLRADFSEAMVEPTLKKLEDLKYIDDAEFARQKLGESQRKLMGQRRVMADLMRSGVKGAVAQEAVRAHLSKDQSKENARQLVEKTLPRLRRLDPVTAKRRLVGLLQRRGFEYDDIKPLVDQYLAEPKE